MLNFGSFFFCFEGCFLSMEESRPFDYCEVDMVSLCQSLNLEPCQKWINEIVYGLRCLWSSVFIYPNCMFIIFVVCTCMCTFIHVVPPDA